MYKLSQYLLGFMMIMSLSSFALAQGNLFCSNSWWRDLTLDNASRTIELYRESFAFAIAQTCNQQEDTPLMIALRSIPDPISSEQFDAFLVFITLFDEHDVHHISNTDGYTAWIIGQLRWQRALRRWNNDFQNNSLDMDEVVERERFEIALFILLLQKDLAISSDEAIDVVRDGLLEHISTGNLLDRLEELLGPGLLENLLNNENLPR